MDKIAKIIVAIFNGALVGVGLSWAYKSYGLFQSGQILEAMYVLIFAGILLRK